MEKTKPFEISYQVFEKAFERVKANKGSYGVDEQTILEYEENLERNLYKLWNRMSSGTYFPKPVKAVSIPKKNGGARILGIPTVEDRVAQMVAKIYFEPKVEKIFYEESYGYRPNKSAIDAVGKARENCWRYDWVVDFDIKGLFDNINHDYLIKLVKMHTNEKWIILYIERWLKTPFQLEYGTLQERTSGTPQGGVISPVLANLFMHYAFDNFMKMNYLTIPFERYADDGVAHCKTLKQAEYLVDMLDKRFRQCGIELNLNKTKIVYCKDSNRQEIYDNISFDFLGYTFRSRVARNKQGKKFQSFQPAISDKAKKNIKKEVRSWKLQRKVYASLEDISKMYNSKIQGWINYYSHYYTSEMIEVYTYINMCLQKWVRKKFKNIRSRKQAGKWLQKVIRRDNKLFAHWKKGIINGMVTGSRMMGDYQVRF